MQPGLVSNVLRQTGTKMRHSAPAYMRVWLKNMKCVRQTEILVEQQPPQGVFVCDHAGLVINKFSLGRIRWGPPHAARVPNAAAAAGDQRALGRHPPRSCNRGG